jgi:AraC-like DNA-binding protein
MHDVLGSAAEELVDRLHTADSSAARRDAVFDVLSRPDVAIKPACAHVDRAWEMIVASNGALSLDGVAGAIGWSRRHLDRAFASEFGLTPKDVARVARFTHSREMLQQHPSLSLAALGSACGYFDQAHMAREWNQLAGQPASAWWADEGVRFFQAPGQGASAP